MLVGYNFICWRIIYIIRDELILYQVNAVTEGTDAQGEVTVRLEDENFKSQAKGSDPDIIVASAKAYINAVNKLI